MPTTEEMLTTLLERSTLDDRRKEIRAAISNIPRYDGETKSLSRFLRRVAEEFEEIDAQDEPIYLRSVIKKLDGPAWHSVEGKGITSINDLVKHLKSKFAPGRSASSYTGEIHRLSIKNDETVRQFITRTETLVRKARAAVKGDRPAAEAAGSLKDLEANALTSFLRGLPNKIYLSICHRAPATLDAAFDLALNEDRERRNRKHAVGLKDRSSSRSHRKSKKKSHKGKKKRRDESSSSSDSDTSDSSSESSESEEEKSRPVYAVDSDHSVNEKDEKRSRWTPRHRRPAGREEFRPPYTHCKGCGCTDRPPTENRSFRWRNRSPSPYASDRASSASSAESLNYESARPAYSRASAKGDYRAPEEFKTRESTHDRKRQVRFLEKEKPVSSKKYHQPELKSSRHSSDKGTQSSW